MLTGHQYLGAVSNTTQSTLHPMLSIAESIRHPLLVTCLDVVQTHSKYDGPNRGLGPSPVQVKHRAEAREPRRSRFYMRPSC